MGMFSVDSDDAVALLRSIDPKENEESIHPWYSPPDPELNGRGPYPEHILRTREVLWDQPLLRLWVRGDTLGDPHHARDDRARLDTREARKQALQNHIGQVNGTPNPFITYTLCPEEVANRARQQEIRTQDAKNFSTLNISVWVIDPRRRFELGLPVLSMAYEMAHYDIKDPYQRDAWYRQNEFLIPWNVDDEIVTTELWAELRENPNWYQEVTEMMHCQRRERDQSRQGISHHLSLEKPILTSVFKIPVRSMPTQPQRLELRITSQPWENRLRFIPALTERTLVWSRLR